MEEVFNYGKWKSLRVDSAKSISIPLLAGDTSSDNEKMVWVINALNSRQLRVIGTIKGDAEVGFEDIGFIDI